MSKIIETEPKEFSLLGNNYKTAPLNFELRIWAVKFANKFNQFCRTKTNESKTILYELIMQDDNLKSLIGKGINPETLANQFVNKTNSKIIVASLNFQSDLNEAKLEYFSDKKNIDELISNYLVDCKIDLDSISDVTAFAKEVEGVYDHFLAQFGKQNYFV